VSIRDLTRPGRPEGFRPDPRIVYALSEAERQVRLHACNVGVVDNDLLPELALALGALGLEKVMPAAFDRTTLPVAVSLKRLATDFLVLLRAMALGMGGGRFQRRAPLATIKRLKGLGLKDEGTEPASITGTLTVTRLAR